MIPAVYVIKQFLDWITFTYRRNRALKQFPSPPGHWLMGNIRGVRHYLIIIVNNMLFVRPKVITRNCPPRIEASHFQIMPATDSVSTFPLMLIPELIIFTQACMMNVHFKMKSSKSEAALQGIMVKVLLIYNPAFFWLMYIPLFGPKWFRYLKVLDLKLESHYKSQSFFLSFCSKD